MSFFSLFSTLVGIADSCSDLNRLCFQTIWNPAVIGKSSPERCNWKICELVLANSPSVYIYTVVRTLWLHRVCFGPWLSKQLLLRTTPITLNAREYPNGLYNKYHKIYLSGPFGISVLRHPTEPSPLLASASNRKHHHYPTIPRGPCWSKSRVFSGILTVYFNC